MHRRMVETDAAEAEASLAALLDEEASKLRILQVALQRGVDLRRVALFSLYFSANAVRNSAWDRGSA
jgi:hypothetical protein